MANKIVNIDQLEEDLTAVADALRAKDGSEELLEYPDGFVDKINEFYSANDFALTNKPTGIIYYEGTTLPVANLFSNHTEITAIIAPNITDLVASGFGSNCSASTIILDKLGFMRSYSLYNQKNITTYVLPRLSSINASYCFASCTNLTTLDLGGKDNSTSAQINNTTTFNGDTKLSKIILRNTNLVWDLKDAAILNPTCFGSGKTGGTLYVPENLIFQYEAHTNWAIILGYPNNSILPIEGSQYEDYYADGRLISSVL